MSSAKEVGNRIRYLRMLTRLNRREFCKTFGFKENTLTAIELGQLSLSEQKMKELLDIFSSENIVASPQWLMSGEGPAPSKINGTDEVPQIERDSIMVTMEDNSMKPFYEKGDYVGGDFCELDESLSGERCIIRFINGTTKVRIIHKAGENYILQAANFLTSAPQFSIVDKKEIKVAPITWHKRRV